VAGVLVRSCGALSRSAEGRAVSLPPADAPVPPLGGASGARAQDARVVSELPFWRDLLAGPC